jgi:predicted dehydrogenase
MARIGIIGTGWGARVQVPRFREAGLEVVGIAGSNEEKTREVARKLDVPAATGDWREIIRSREVELVSIVTPPSEHAEMAIAALEAGKHVLCEKPTAIHSAEAERMLDAAKARPHQLSLIDHELRFLPSWIEGKLRVQEIGPVRHVEVRYSSPSRADRDRPWNWWSEEAKGGGVLGAIGSHAFDSLRYLAGEIVAVRAMLNTFVTERPHEDDWRRVTSDDYAAAFVRFEHGALGSMVMSVVSAVDEPTVFTIHGELGGIRLTGSSLELASIGGEWTTIMEESSPGAGDSPGGAFGTGTYHLGRALVLALDEGDTDALAAAATFEDGLRQQRCLDAARRSAIDHGGWIGV